MRRTTRFLSLRFVFLGLTLWAPVASSQAPTITHGFCTVVLGGTQYFSGVFSAPMEKDPRGADPTYHTSTTWGRAFSDYVTQKYGGQAAAGSCGLQPSLAQAQTARTSAIDLNRRLSRKVLEIDWAPTSATPPESATPPMPAPAASSGQTPPNASAQGTTIRSFCYSDLQGQGPVIYFSQVFDTGLGQPDKGVDIFAPIANEFHQYLKGRYDYKTSANLPTGCVGYLSAGQAGATRGELMARFGTGKRVVELEWEYSPDTAAVAPGVTPPLDHGYCVSPSATGTVYTAGPFQLKGRMGEDWNRAFSQFLAGKYAFRGDASCAIGMPRARAQRWFSFHVQGARAGTRKVVETGWELGTTTPSSAAAKPNEPNADREPARPPAPAATPSQQVREFANKEAPEALAYCQKDKATEWALDCYKVQRAVYNYRMAHAAEGTPEPLATLLTGDKLDCTDCVDNMRTPGWAKQQAHSQGLQPAVVDCIAQRIVSTFQAKPYVNRLKEAYAATVAACKR